MNPEILRPFCFSDQKNAAQKISRERRMIEVATVRVSPFESVFVQNFGEPVKEDRVVSADCVVSDRDL